MLLSTANVPAIVVLSNEVVPATVRLSDIVTVSAKVALSLTNIVVALSNKVMPVTVRLSDIIALAKFPVSVTVCYHKCYLHLLK